MDLNGQQGSYKNSHDIYKYFSSLQKILAQIVRCRKRSERS